MISYLTKTVKSLIFIKMDYTQEKRQLFHGLEKQYELENDNINESHEDDLHLFIYNFNSSLTDQ